MRKHFNLFLTSAMLTLIFITSCKKEPIVPGNYKLTQQIVDTSSWQSQYGNGGTLSNWGSATTTTTNELVGTKWVLTYLQIGYSNTPLPIDTIRFINNTNYTINNGAFKTYQLSSGVTLSSKTLTLNYHYPFGSGNYVGQVSTTFVTDGVILNCEFLNINTTTTTIRASFLKL